MNEYICDPKLGAERGGWFVEEMYCCTSIIIIITRSGSVEAGVQQFHHQIHKTGVAHLKEIKQLACNTCLIRSSE